MRLRGGAALLLLVTACGVDLPLRDDITYTCNATGDCPLQLSCAVGIHQCVSELDTTPPRLTSITATDRETVALVFDEAIGKELAALPTSFTLVRDDGQALTVAAAGALPDGKSIVLRTGLQRGAALYTVATTVTDAQGNLPQLDASTFTGFGPAPDTLPPEVTAPTPATVRVVPEEERDAPTVTLAWNPRGGAISYTLDISTVDIAKHAPFDIIDQTVELPGDQLNYVLAVREGTTYFWRVRSDATVANTYGQGSFTILFDTIYVYCAPTKAACLSGDGIGSKNVPLAAVSRAVTLATDRELPHIAVASRGGTLGYHEPVAITGSARSLRGGYNADFSGSVDIGVDPTRLFYEGAVLIVLQNTGPVSFDGLSIEATIDPLAPTQQMAAASLSNLQADVTFLNTTIATAYVEAPANPLEELPFNATALAITQSPFVTVTLGPGSRAVLGSAAGDGSAVIVLGAKLTIDRASIVAHASFGSSRAQGIGCFNSTLAADRLDLASGGIGMALFACTSTIHDSKVVASGENAAGVTTDFGTLTLENNRIIVASPTDTEPGIRLDSSTSRIVNNTVIATGSGTVVGIRTAVGLHLLANNTIVVSGAATQATAIELEETHPDIVNSLIVCLPGVGGTTGMRETQVQSDPSAIVGNVIVGCATAYLDEAATTVSDLDTLAGQTIDCSTSCGTSQALGNATLAAADPFVSVAGADGLLETLDDDLHLATSNAAIINGGIDTHSTVCGSNQAPRACGDVSSDLDGASRTLPLSVGAYEKDTP